MTFQVLRSQIIGRMTEEAFADAVKSHAKEMAIHEKHMEQVRQKKADAYPAPNPHPLIVNSVRRDEDQRRGTVTFTPDYVIVDHLPIARNDQAALATRKEELRQAVAVMEQESIFKLLPRGKWRLANIEYAEAMNKPGPQRTSSDIQLMTDHDKRQSQVKVIQRYYATLEAQIEDLDTMSVNLWTPKPFEGK